MRSPSAEKPDRHLDRRLMTMRRLGGLPLVVAIAAPFASGLLLVVQAWLLANVLGRSIEGGEPFDAMVPMIAGIALLLVLRAGIGLLGEQSGAVGAERVKSALRRSLFAGMLDTRRSHDAAPASGAVSAALIDQVEALEGFFARYLPAMAGAAVLPVAFSVVLFPVDWIVALLFLLSAPMIPLFMALAGWGAQLAADRQADAFARLSGHFADRLRGLLTIKLFGRAEDATREVYDASEELRRRTGAVLAIAFLSSAILEFFAALGVAGVALYVGLTYLGFLNVQPGLTLTAGLFALLMAPEVYQPLRQLATHYHDRASARSVLGQIDKLFPARANEEADNEEADVALPEPSDKGGRGAGALEAEDVTVHAAGHRVLDNLRLDVFPGEKVAIMGESGIGKSTLVRALTRLLPCEGTIRLDGRDLTDLDETELRTRIACLMQKPRIFHGTIVDNIRLADPHASAEAVADAAWRAGVLDFAADFEHGLETLVGEDGEGLSGGQAQRVALARIFLRDPNLLILDEPTAHLDRATERDVLEAIAFFARGRTVLIVTHSPVVAAWADRVLRLVDGRLKPVSVPAEAVGEAV